jgi:uncharacterized protein (TIGR02145 family)
MKKTYKYLLFMFLLALIIAGCENENDITINENPPTADFSYNKTRIFQGEKVTFTDLSTNDPDSWMWNFGTTDDTTSTQSPSKTFSHVGTYSVSLTVSNGYGADSITVSDCVVVDTLVMGTSGTVTDIDGNTYNTINIGTQEWMAENLKVSHYSDGTEITLIEDNSEWSLLADDDASAAYCYLDNESSSEYGALYTYGAAIRACPEGWHLPSDEEWKQLEMYIGLTQDAADSTGWRGIDEGLKLKSSAGWDKNNGTVDFGFNALPGAYRYSSTGGFYAEGSSAYFWTSTEGDSDNAYYRLLSCSYDQINRNNLRGKSYGFSVRCVKD